jgi:L-iditol 2-dehydrogenase
MIAARYVPEQGLEISDVPMPEAGADELLIKVEATAICGTDLKIVRNGSRKAKPGQSLVLGHEFVGTVQDTGSHVKSPARGTRVGVAPNFGCGRCGACIRGTSNMCADYSAFGIDMDGSHASYIRIPAAAIEQGNVFQLPDNAAWEEAALAEPLSCVLNAQHGVNVAAGDTVLVYGAGPMGLLHVLLAAASGAASVIVADINADRLALAGEIGATSTVNSTAERVTDHVGRVTNGRGVDVVFTATPVPGIVTEALTLLAPFGRLSVFAGLVKGKSEVVIDANLIHYRSLHMTGTTGGCNTDYQKALQLIASRNVDVRPIISHVFPMSKLDEAYALAFSGNARKIVIRGE